jgi:hypothetical protein
MWSPFVCLNEAVSLLPGLGPVARIGTGAFCYVPPGLDSVYVLHSVVVGSRVNGCRAVAGTMAGHTPNALTLMCGMVTGCRRNRVTAAAGRGRSRRWRDGCQDSSNRGDLRGRKTR